MLSQVKFKAGITKLALASDGMIAEPFAAAVEAREVLCSQTIVNEYH